MNNNVVDGIIASMLFGVLSTGIGLVLQFLGLNTQLSSGIAVLAFLLLFLSGRNLYPKYKRKMKTRVVREILNSREIEDVALKNQIVIQRLEDILNSKHIDDEALKHQIITRILRDHPLIVSSQNIPVQEYENQIACEAEICEAFRAARKIKILTIRGERYFSNT